MTGRPARDRWVVCDEYTAGPYTADLAEREVQAIARLAESHAIGCRLEHRIVAGATKPVPPWKEALEATQP